jgi:uncharacterized RDD family membrane protein YckC
MNVSEGNMAQNWYYARGNDQFGPVTMDQLKSLIGTGQVQMADLVWTEGMAQWVPELVSQTTANPYIAPPPPAANPYVANPYAANPYATNPAAPNAAWPGQPSPGVLGYQAPVFGQQAYAGFWLRFCAAFVDGIIVQIVLIILNIILFAAVGENYFDYWPQTRPMSGAAAGMSGLGSLIGIIIAWLYGAIQESSARQATLGKLAVGIVVTDLNGQRISFARATGRHFGKYISMIILFIGYIMAGLTERKQALHDMMAGALVVKKQV